MTGLGFFGVVFCYILLVKSVWLLGFFVFNFVILKI